MTNTITAPAATYGTRPGHAPVQGITPLGAPVSAHGAIGRVTGTLAGWSQTIPAPRPIVAYEKHGRAYRSSTWDGVTIRRAA